MDATFAITGKDFVLFASDSSVRISIKKMKLNQRKTIELDDNKMIAWNGKPSDALNFADFVSRSHFLYTIRNGFPMSVKASAHFIRNELARAVRKSPVETNIMIGGVDESGSSLYYLDYMGSINKLNVAAHGYCAFFVTSILDRSWKEDLEREEALEMAKRCVEELGQRFTLSLDNFEFCFVTKDGAQRIE
ncbi:Proteasome subunit beta type-2 [Bonamia ostreae]|uniref:Proteasome subunit beta n=1 Tax=Bonamia ostreae TaxID=126728 RepID=A0ABV2APR8_9EUKA